MPKMPTLSLSARRAWIEIEAPPGGKSWRVVALRKESVDRNTGDSVLRIFTNVALRKESVDRNLGNQVLRVSARPSLSARRAWIEIIILWRCTKMDAVALRKESVDRNLLTAGDVTAPSGRSPQGERG